MSERRHVRVRITEALRKARDMAEAFSILSTELSGEAMYLDERIEAQDKRIAELEKMLGKPTS